MAGKVTKVPGDKYAGVYQRGPNSFTFQIKVQDGTGRWVQEWHSGFQSKRAAKEARDEMLAKVRKGQHVRRTTQTLGDYLDEWLDGLLDIRESTVHGYRKNAEAYIKPALGHVSLQALTVPRINAFYKAIMQGGGKGGRALSPRTVEHCHATLRRALRDAVVAGLIPSNPALSTTRPKVVRTPYEPKWKPEHVRKYLAALEVHPLRAALTVAATTGARRSEVVAIKWGDLDLKAGMLQIRRARTVVGKDVVEAEPKTAAGRRDMPLTPLAVEALRELRDELSAEGFDRINADRYVFQDEDGQPIHPDVISRAHKTLVKRLGLPYMSVKELRHTAASLMALGGVPIEVLTGVLGHADASTTWRHYRGLYPSERTAAVAAFDVALGGEAG